MGHGLQPLALGENEASGFKLLLFGEPAAAQGVGVADNGGQRGLQLVGKGGREILLPLGGFLQRSHVVLQLLRHVVELLRKGADLVAGVNLGAGGVFSRGDLAGGPGQPADGRGQQGAQGEACQQAYPDGDEKHGAVGLQILLPDGIDGADIPAVLQKKGLSIHGKPGTSAFLMVSEVVPIRRTPCSARNPLSASSIPRFSPA